MYAHGDSVRGIDSGPFHHSSFVRGKEVYFAGQIETNEDGFIRSISNESGHYQPSDRHADYALEFFISKGVDLSQVTYKSVTNGEGLIEINALEFLKKMIGEM